MAHPDIPRGRFVVLFRQGRPLTEAQLKQRAEATRLWAGPLNTAGHRLTPHLLAPQTEWIAPQDVPSPEAAPEGAAVTALLFLEADDWDAAVALVRTHPALGFGASAEVRSWTASPAPAPVPAAT